MASGPDGDFALPNGQAPIEWNYGQHYLSLFSSNSSGIFSMMFFNNGNSRMVDTNGDPAGARGRILCYSSVPTYQLDESALTAQVAQETNLPPPFSVCCGDGRISFQRGSGVRRGGSIANGSFIQEVTQWASPQLVGK